MASAVIRESPRTRIGQTEIDRNIIWPKGAKEETQISLDSNQCCGRGSVDGRGHLAEGKKTDRRTVSTKPIEVAQ